MNAKLLLPIISAALFPLAAYAHDCSGGADGGIDATGNQCNREIVAASASSGQANHPPRLKSVEAEKLTAKKVAAEKVAAKDRIGVRDPSVPTRAKRG